MDIETKLPIFQKRKYLWLAISALILGIGLAGMVVFRKKSIFEKAVPICSRMPRLIDYRWLDANRMILTEQVSGDPAVNQDSANVSFSEYDLRTKRKTALVGLNERWSVLNRGGANLDSLFNLYSPDGRWVRVTSSSPPLDNWVLSLDGATKIHVPGHLFDSNIWFPDSSGLFNLEYVYDRNDNVVGSKIFRYGLNRKTKPEMLPPNNPLFTPPNDFVNATPIPNSPFIAICKERSHDFGAESIQVSIYDFRSLEKIAEYPVVQSPLQLAPRYADSFLSPDATKIIWVFSREKNPLQELLRVLKLGSELETYEIYITDVKGSKFTSLGKTTMSSRSEFDFAWSPDEKRISYLANGVIYVAPID